MTRDSKINEEIQKHLDSDDLDSSIEEISLSAYKALSQEERKIYAKKIVEEVKERIFMNVEDESDFEGFLVKNKSLLKLLTNEDKLFIAETEWSVIDNLFENAKDNREIKAIFDKHNINPEDYPNPNNVAKSLSDEFIIDCMDYVYFSDDGDWGHIAYLTCGCLTEDQDSPAAEKYALYLMDAFFREQFGLSPYGW